MPTQRALTLVSALCFFAFGCDQNKERNSVEGAPQEPLPTPTAPKKEGTPSDNSGPTPLLDAEESAYGTRMFTLADELILFSGSAVYRSVGGEKLTRTPLELGRLPTLLDDHIAYIRDKSIFSWGPGDDKQQLRLKLDVPPQYLLSAGPRLIWLSRSVDRKVYTIQTESAAAIADVYSSKNELTSPVVHDEAVYFLEKEESAWRIGRAPLNGSSPTFGPFHESRVPPSLEPGPDGIYFYDGPERGVRRVSFDLSTEISFAEGLICSPLVVSTRVVCAQVGGIVDIPRQGAPPRTVATEAGGPIAEIVATDSKVYWVADRGRNRMSVRSAPLPAL